MISKFDLNYDLTDEMNGTILETKALGSSGSNSVPIYIKTVMANITKGNPTDSVLSTAGSSVFKNANRKPALTKNVLTEQNYVTGTIYKDTNAGDVDKTTELITSYMKDHIDKRYHSITTQNILYEVSKGTTARVSYLNGKISKLCFSLTSNSGTSEALS
jgi:hypothetical protein